MGHATTLTATATATVKATLTTKTAGAEGADGESPQPRSSTTPRATSFTRRRTCTASGTTPSRAPRSFARWRRLARCDGTRTPGVSDQSGRIAGRLSASACSRGTTRTRTCTEPGRWAATRSGTRTRSCPRRRMKRRRRKKRGRMRGGEGEGRTVGAPARGESARFGVSRSPRIPWRPPRGTRRRSSRSRSGRFTCSRPARSRPPSRTRRGLWRSRRRGRRRRRRRCRPRRTRNEPNSSTRRPCSSPRTDPRSRRWRARGNAAIPSSASSSAARTRGTTGTSWASAVESWEPGRGR